jgi:transcriptional regulator with GAF, ATPase, and Fis domain
LAERGTIQIPNLVDQAATLAVPQRFDEPPRRSSPPPASEAAPASDGLAEVTRSHILRVLDEVDWVVAGPNGAAARLDMKRSTLNFRMKKLGITRPTPRTAEEP